MSEETKNTEEQLEATEVQETSAPAVEETVGKTATVSSHEAAHNQHGARADGSQT